MESWTALPSQQWWVTVSMEYCQPRSCFNLGAQSIGVWGLLPTWLISVSSWANTMQLKVPAPKPIVRLSSVSLGPWANKNTPISHNIPRAWWEAKGKTRPPFGQDLIFYYVRAKPDTPGMDFCRWQWGYPFSCSHSWNDPWIPQIHIHYELWAGLCASC